jgi:hypothetical protein
VCDNNDRVPPPQVHQHAHVCMHACVLLLLCADAWV